MAAHLGNEAERAGSIASLGDLDVRIVAGRRQQSWRGLVVQISGALIAERNHRQRSRAGLRIAHPQNLVDLARADESVDLRHLSFELIAVALNQTAGDN